MDDNTIRFLGPVAIRLLKTDFTVSPGSSIEIPVILINQGTKPDFFELSIRGLPLEWVTIPSPVTRIEAGAQQEIRVRIQPPAETSPVGFYPMVVRAVSQEAPDQMAEVPAGLKVAAYEVTGRIGLLLDAVQFSVQPGSSTVVGLVVTNHGQTAGTYQIVVEGIPASWISTPSPTISLQAGSSLDVSLTIRPPRTAESRAGRHTFRVQVVSQQHPDEMAVVDGTLVIGTFNRFASELVPNQVEAGQSGQLRIENQGNAPDAFTINWQSPNNALVVESSYPVPLRVEPGETAVVEFIARPSQQRWIGGPAPYPFTVNVESTRREAQSLSGTALTRGMIPVWVLPVLLTVCLAFACITAWVLSRNEPQQVDVIGTQTAAAVAGVGAAETQAAAVAMSTQTSSANQTAAALAGQQDTDGDGLTDAQEAQLGTSPTTADTDNDRLNDGDEVRLKTNPLNPDTDGDGQLDGADLDPLDANNPSLTATAAVLAPTATLTASPAPATATTAPSAVPPTAAPTQPPAASATPANQLPTPVPLPGLPVTNKGVILFASNREGSFKIYLLSTINATLVRMTSGNGDDREPVLSPSGDRIAFTSNRDGNNEIYVINVNGTGLTNLTANPGDDHSPTWSPDGARLLFVSNRSGNQEVYVMNADGSGAANLTNNPAEDTQPAWLVSGSSTRILFGTNRDGNQEVYVMNADGGSPTNLTSNPANDFAPAAFPNGNLIAFTSERDTNREIYVMNLDGSGQANRTNTAGNDQDPAWAPDGTWIAFMSDRETDPEIFVMQANGSQQSNLSANDANDVDPSWR